MENCGGGKMTSFVTSPKVRELIRKAKESGGAVTCDPQKQYPIGHLCAGSTDPVKAPSIPYDAGGVQIPVKPDAKIVAVKPAVNGGKITTFQTATDTVEATTAKNGGVEKVEVKQNNLIPLALAAAALFLLGG